MLGAEGLQQFVLHQHCAVDTDVAPLSRNFASVDRYMQLMLLYLEQMIYVANGSEQIAVFLNLEF
jgi:hypothetical protein